MKIQSVKRAMALKISFERQWTGSWYMSELFSFKKIPFYIYDLPFFQMFDAGAIPRRMRSIPYWTHVIALSL